MQIAESSRLFAASRESWAPPNPLKRSVRTRAGAANAAARLGTETAARIAHQYRPVSLLHIERIGVPWNDGGENGCASWPSLDPGKCIADAGRLPGRGWRWLTARKRDVGPLSLSQNDLPASRRNGYTAAFHEDPEYAAAWAGKKTRAPDSNKSIRAPDGHRQRRRSRSSIEQHRSRLQRDHPTRIDEKAVDLHAGPFAQLYRRVTSEPHTQPGFRLGPHLIRDEDGRGMRE